MSASVIYKIPSRIKRVVFTERRTTRGTRFKQSTVKAPRSPLRSPSKRSQLADDENFEQGGFDEPLIQHKSKVSSTFVYDSDMLLISRCRTVAE
jgi:hypothetical protein